MLIPIADEDWRRDIEANALKCAREGDPVDATITTELLRKIAGH